MILLNWIQPGAIRPARVWERLRQLGVTEIAGWGSAGVAGTRRRAVAIPAGRPALGTSSIRTGTVNIRTFGGLQVTVDGQRLRDIDWPTSARRLVELLLCLPEHATTARQAAALLWPQHLERSAINSFHVALHALRRMLEPGLAARAQPLYVVRQGRIYRLCVERLTCDLADFARLLPSAQEPALRYGAWRLESLLRMWREGFLEPSSDRFVRDKRADLRRAVVDAVERVGEEQFANGDTIGAARTFRRLLDIELLREDIWARVAELHLAAGEEGQALAVLLRCEHVLRAAAIEPCGLIRDLRRRLTEPPAS
jgi:DNA-binding SARP family transcriptional activator